MSDIYTLSAESRAAQGKGASRRLRRLENKIPAIVYGIDKEPQAISLLANEMAKATENEAFYSHILTLVIDGNEEQAVLKDLQRHPSKSYIMHADFQRVKKGQKLSMSVPLHFINEDKCPGVKQEHGIVSHQITEVEIECLPRNLPEYLEVDMAELHVGDVVHLSDIKLPEGIEILALQQGPDHDLTVANLQVPRGAAESDSASDEAAAGDAEADSGDTE